MMDPTNILSKADESLKNTVEHFENELKKLRTGRAHPSMLDDVTAEAYGQQMPLKQLATISTPEPQLLQVSPFDPNNIEAISSAIRDNQTLGLNPMDDGHVVRIPIPPLTEERRRDIAKQLNQKVEDCMISARNIRHDSLKQLDKAKNDKDIGEDEHKRLNKQIEDLMSKTKTDVDNIAKAKEKEILTV
ncbi:ribosome recycling factor [Candidatus Saccharibacteria bacterium]|nr:ribosome recycling factor [Candidatus Saccharibacteria bacterium]